MGLWNEQLILWKNTAIIISLKAAVCKCSIKIDVLKNFAKFPGK